MNLSNKLKEFPCTIPEGSIVGVNYSGMHDTSVAVVAPDGAPVYAVSLERYSRVKQDGRSPLDILEGMPWERVSKVGVSVSESYVRPSDLKNKYHPIELEQKQYVDRAHGNEFSRQLGSFPVEVEYVAHHLAHAASAFWTSGFADASCLVYDGGMANEEWFGGVYDASRGDGVTAGELFSASCYANVTRIYTGVTALLGFTPLKHEGKITGLAANGKPTKKCRDVLERWFHDTRLLDGLLSWRNMYQTNSIPKLELVPGFAEMLRAEIEQFSSAELAATVQAITEEHILSIVNKIREEKDSNCICLSGGLFANVKVNQKVSEAGFKKTYICPSMSDDGAALGAALHVAAHDSNNFSPNRVKNVYWGPAYSSEEVYSAIKASGTRSRSPSDASQAVAELLNEGAIVAVFNGAMEFGPRALGNRSILAKADNYEINEKLNGLLHRTEFMPFAPICCKEDSELLFKGINKVEQAAEFMTVTVDCTEKMSDLHPAAVHVDGTARPQLVSQESNKLIHDILVSYKALSGRYALVNTSFNIHEEPIIMTPEDALKGFYESGIDAILLGDCLIKQEDNVDVALSYVRRKLNGAILTIKENKKEIYQREVDGYRAAAHNEKALREVREACQKSECVAQEAVSKMDQSNIKLGQANEQLDKILDLFGQAEERTTQSELRVKKAEEDFAVANQRVDMALRLAEQAREDVKIAEINVSREKARADEFNKLADQAELRVGKLEASASQAEKVVADSALRLVHAEAAARSAQAQYQAILNSSSWRMTAPIRSLVNKGAWVFIGASAWLKFKPGSRPQRTFNLGLLHMRKWVSRRPMVKAGVLRLLSRVPKLYALVPEDTSPVVQISREGVEAFSDFSSKYIKISSPEHVFDGGAGSSLKLDVDGTAQHVYRKYSGLNVDVSLIQAIRDGRKITIIKTLSEHDLDNLGFIATHIYLALLRRFPSAEDERSCANAMLKSQDVMPTVARILQSAEFAELGYRVID